MAEGGGDSIAWNYSNSTFTTHSNYNINLGVHRYRGSSKGEGTWRKSFPFSIFYVNLFLFFA